MGKMQSPMSQDAMKVCPGLGSDGPKAVLEAKAGVMDDFVCTE